MTQKPRKWITWEIPKKSLDDITSKQEEELAAIMRDEITKALEDMIHGLPVSFKVTNLPRDF